jgi:glycosidase
VRGLLRLRREHDALHSGQLWHLAADDSSYVFVRESEEERLAVAFNNSTSVKVLKLSLRDTPAENATALSVLFGNAHAELAGWELRLTLAPQSLSIIQLR